MRGVGPVRSVRQTLTLQVELTTPEWTELGDVGVLVLDFDDGGDLPVTLVLRRPVKRRVTKADTTAE